MSKDTSRASDGATEIGLTLEQLIQRGARDLLHNAIEVEVRGLLAEYGNVRTLSGAASVVRNGYLPAREILTAVGPVQVRVPKVRDRSGAGEYAVWMKRDRSPSRYLYWWADGIHTGVREEDAARSCLLVIIGVTPEGKKELVTISDGLRESTESWLEVLRDLKARGSPAGRCWR